MTTIDSRELIPGSAAATCIAAVREHAPRGRVVTRIGVSGTSVTFRTASGRGTVACDGGGGNERRHWCGRALGRLEHGRLVDPRLDLAGCETGRGEPVAFAWIEPDRGAQYVTVHDDGFAEVYPVVGGLPVRVTATTGIDLEASSAAYEILEHDRAGHLLRSYTLEAHVAG